LAPKKSKLKKNTKEQPKKKKWFKLVASKVFKEMVIGETVAETETDMVGRTVALSLMNLTRDMRKQNITVTFEVTEAKDKKGHCNVKAYKMIPSGVKRKVRRGKSLVVDSIVLKTKDEKFARIKPMIITNNVCHSPIKKDIRKAVRAYLKEYVNNTDFEDIIGDVVANRFGKKVKEAVAKIYPIRAVEVKEISIEAKAKAESDLGKYESFAKEEESLEAEAKVEEAETSKE
jgi:ribosomal protein S3AE